MKSPISLLKFYAAHKFTFNIQNYVTLFIKYANT